MSRLVLLGVLSVFSSAVFAESMVNPFPAGRVFPQPVGILFPSFNVAPGVNASSIPANNRGTAVAAAVSPTTNSANAMQYFGSAASSSSTFGGGVSYIGSSYAGSMTHGAAAGLGYSFETFSLGLGARDLDVKSGWDPSVDASLMLLALKDFIAGAVFYNLNQATQLDLGIGVKSGQRYNVEVNLLLPPFSDLGGGYTATVSAAIFVEPFGLHFRSSYNTAYKDFSHTIALGAWVSKVIHIAAQFTTPRTFTFGLTALF